MSQNVENALTEYLKISKQHFNHCSFFLKFHATPLHVENSIIFSFIENPLETVAGIYL